MSTIGLLLAGFVATTIMIAVMEVIHRLRLANADMVRAIGSLYTRSYEYSVVPGLVIHYTAGISFALLYGLLTSFAPVATTGGIVVLCMFAGLVHGIVFSLFLAILVAEHHPLAEFRRASLGVMLSHIAGHVFYGTALGFFFGLTNAKESYLATPFLPSFAREMGGVIGYGALWMMLFGIPALFFGLLAYATWVHRLRRIAHEADAQSGHDEPVDRRAA